MFRGDKSRGRTQGREKGAHAAPFSFVVALKPASGKVLIAGGSIGTHEISVEDAQVLFEGLRSALGIPFLAATLLQDAAR